MKELLLLQKKVRKRKKHVNYIFTNIISLLEESVFYRFPCFSVGCGISSKFMLALVLLLWFML